LGTRSGRWGFRAGRKIQNSRQLGPYHTFGPELYKSIRADFWVRLGFDLGEVGDGRAPGERTLCFEGDI
jgi:hypothetical protein